MTRKITQSTAMKKIWQASEINDLSEEIEMWQSFGQKVVCTGGHFNICHAGHIDLLENAARLGEFLVVAVNSDESSIRKAGYSFLPLEDRLRIISSFRFVDFVVVNPFDSMCWILEKLHPSIYAKGGDRIPANMLTLELDVCAKIECLVAYNIGGNKSRSSSEFLESYWRYRQKQHEFQDCLDKLKDI